MAAYTDEEINQGPLKDHSRTNQGPIKDQSRTNQGPIRDQSRTKAFFFTIFRASGNLREAVKEEEGEAAVGTIHRRGKTAAAYGLLLAKKRT